VGGSGSTGVRRALGNRNDRESDAHRHHSTPRSANRQSATLSERTLAVDPGGDNPVYELVHMRWMTKKFWGFQKSLVDNPGDLKLLLDLGFRERECVSRTGERTQTGVERPSLGSQSFGAGGTEDGPDPRGESGSGRSEKPHASKHRVAGQPGATGGEVTGRKPSKHPNCEFGGSPAASDDGTVYRVSVNGVEGPTGPGDRQTGVPSPGVEVGQPADANGRHRHRETDVAPRGNGPGQPGDRVSTPVTEAG
jgi:hypothetical protein